MTTPTKKPLHSKRKRNKGAKAVIWVAAFAGTFGGWVAMAANEGASSPGTASSQDSSLVASSVQMQDAGQLSSAQSGISASRADGMLGSYVALRPEPISVTRSSR